MHLKNTLRNHQKNLTKYHPTYRAVRQINLIIYTASKLKSIIKVKLENAGVPEVDLPDNDSEFFNIMFCCRRPPKIPTSPAAYFTAVNNQSKDLDCQNSNSNDLEVETINSPAKTKPDNPELLTMTVFFAPESTHNRMVCVIGRLRKSTEENCISDVQSLFVLTFQWW
ncbi:hypothetical protein CDAR_424901 [Caerostris darwini]|uniref:Uncharacterized protein n=1 Tax=Caerostris darwini TaxID=1538125 RepID=A0AAV4W5V1_9ARAC|nr:hypothetical protein CDAR_424901 [Caerostris darwini]